MTSLVAGWVGSVAVIFILITRPWRSPAARAPLPLILGAAVAVWGLWDGVVVYEDLGAQGAWTAATILIPYVPLKTLVLMLLVYALGRTLLSARQHTGARRYLLPAALAVAAVVALGADVRVSRDAAKVRIARSETLTPQQIAEIARRIADKTALTGEIQAFLQNPLCPPSLLWRYADGPASFKVYIARNPSAPPELLLKLSQDVSAEVRYSAVYNANLPASELPRMAADTDAVVRESVAWKDELPDDVFVHLLKDAEPRVRAAAALQPRISDAALLDLTRDANPDVRANATRIAIQRGLKE